MLVPLKTSKPSLAYMRLSQADWIRREKAYGDAYNTAIIRIVLIAWMEDKPCDISSLAACVYLSRQQTTRRLDALALKGYLIEERRRNRVVILPTETLIAHVEDALAHLLPKLRRGYDKVWRMVDAENAAVVPARGSTVGCNGGAASTLA